MDLQGKVGPLPVAAWGGILGASVLGYMYVQHRRASKAVVVTNPSGTAADNSLPADALGNAGAAAGYPILGAGNISPGTGFPAGNPWDYYPGLTGGPTAPPSVAPLPSPVTTTNPPKVTNGDPLTPVLRSPVPVSHAGRVTLFGQSVHTNAAGIIDTPGANYGRYPGQVTAAAPDRNTSVMVGGKMLHLNAAGIVDTRGPAYGKYPSQVTHV